MSQPQAIEQKRAARAWECIEKVKTAADPFPGKYGGWVKKLPALVLTNGLGQTLAFLRAKGKGEHSNPAQTLYGHISDWVMHQVGPGRADSLLEWLLKQDTAAYRQATVETLAFANWLKRFAEAELKIEEDNE